MTLFLTILTFAVAEIALAFFFSFMASVLYKKTQFNHISIIKGVTERVFLSLALAYNYHHSLTLFSAIKLATRLQQKEDDNNKFNDFFLIGNLFSVGIAIIYAELIKYFYLK